MQKGTLIRIVICLICAMGIVFCLFMILPQLRDYREAEQAYDTLEKQVVTITPTPSAPVEEPAVEEEEEEPVEAAEEIPEIPNENWWYEDVHIDFDALENQNKEIIAWIRFDHQDQVPIDYPVVHAQNNDKYLHTDIHGKSSKAGTLFFEAAVPNPLSDEYRVDIIYGHMMKNGTMFAPLKKYTKQASFYENNPFFTVYAKGEALRYRIFSVFITKAGSDVYRYGYTKNDKQYQEHIDYLKSHSKVQGAEPDYGHRILVLSTCAKSNSDDRIVVIGEMIDRKSTG